MRGNLRVLMAPPGGFPTKYKRDPFDLVRGIPPSKLAALLKASAIGIELHCQLDIKNDDYETAVGTIIRKSLVQISGENIFNLTAPLRVRHQTVKRDYRTLWVADGFSSDGADRVFEFDHWPMDDHTLSVHAISTAPTSYVITYRGFPSDDKEQVLAIVRSYFGGPEMQREIARLVREDKENSPGLDDKAVALAIAEKLEVKVQTLQIDNVMTVTAAVYCDPPTVNPDAWLAWKDRLGISPFVVGESTVIDICQPMRCTECHAGDHECDFCPFRAVPGWKTGLAINNPPRPAPPVAPPRILAHSSATLPAPVTAAPLWPTSVSTPTEYAHHEQPQAPSAPSAHALEYAHARPAPHTTENAYPQDLRAYNAPRPASPAARAPGPLPTNDRSLQASVYAPAVQRGGDYAYNAPQLPAYPTHHEALPRQNTLSYENGQRAPAPPRRDHQLHGYDPTGPREDRARVQGAYAQPLGGRRVQDYPLDTRNVDPYHAHEQANGETAPPPAYRPRDPQHWQQPASNLPSAQNPRPQQAPPPPPQYSYAHPQPGPSHAAQAQYAHHSGQYDGDERYEDYAQDFVEPHPAGGYQNQGGAHFRGRGGGRGGPRNSRRMNRAQNGGHLPPR